MNDKIYKMDPRASLQADGEGGGGVLFDSFTADICTCNDTAWILLEALERGANLKALGERLVEHYQVDADVARRDIVVLLKDLSAMGLVHEQN